MEPERNNLTDMGDATRGLLFSALDVRHRSWCPYSRFAVGAAVLLGDGRSFSGCNVENASYGLSSCAERNAVFAAVAAGMRPGDLKLIAVLGGPLVPRAPAQPDSDPLGALVAPSPTGLTPCGACRQVLMEFAADDCAVICGSVSGLQGGLEALPALTRYWLRDLLPAAFSLD